EPHPEDPPGWASLQDVDPQQPVAQVLAVGAQHSRRVLRAEGADLPPGRAIEWVADPAQVADLCRRPEPVVPVDESILAVTAAPAVGRLVERVDQLAAGGQHLAPGGADGGVGCQPLPA